ncbi:DUF1286 domain-containing protein [Metallosphaera tengchongensis]|uniref:DUF1286 domain-containing protein n=1 Tax=Metallosphaera tengchongensis TaxID=1532350 RepID=A0A6N0NTE5_9CREN|nr:DUF1286 domain-containing protein [Metallosphaera tengchongensis]QKQ99182.1 DUF1286 domain-containing protein [Metallosphaera tengchongensis]
MKLLTHYVFTTGVLTLMSSPFLGFYDSLLVSFIIAWISNSLIDRLGHEVRYGYIRRTPRTHTLLRSLPWGILPSLPLSLILGVPIIAFLGIVAGPSHLVLDVLTERGIYVKRRGRWVRYALAHFAYNNPLLNGLFILIGAVFLYIAMLIQSQPLTTLLF